ncbi:MAG: hypothetical protein IK013_06955 [Bacteroidales bacterium]|nr:hypothetical protein [Bacteroidales bacterium]
MILGHKTYDPNSDWCKACTSIGKCLDKFGSIEQIRQRRREIKEEAKKFANADFFNEKFDNKVTISNRNIKELTNQPHKHYNEKNEAILKIDKLFHDSEYLGELTKEHPDDDFTSFLFETEIATEKSWIIVRKYDRGTDYLIYSISDQSVMTSFLKKKEDR